MERRWIGLCLNNPALRTTGLGRCRSLAIPKQSRASLSLSVTIIQYMFYLSTDYFNVAFGWQNNHSISNSKINLLGGSASVPNSSASIHHTQTFYSLCLQPTKSMVIVTKNHEVHVRDLRHPVLLQAIVSFSTINNIELFQPLLWPKHHFKSRYRIEGTGNRVLQCPYNKSYQPITTTKKKTPYLQNVLLSFLY
ncbi:hypothetical protein V6N13_011599 [Hibiscus sabdariffa]|uniref:Uncharacterized protein n=1 Tax=Hibiscus sabdariffa TaxID=183260 RepID=A0ABR2SDK0_9ROSI